MKWTKLIKVAIKSIIKNRMRSALTILGIVIGVGAVIAMVSVGQGASADIQSQISSLGSNMIIIMPGTSQQGGINRGASSLNSLTMKDVNKIAREGKLIKHTSPLINAPAQVIGMGRNWSTKVQGVSAEYLEIKDWPLLRGEFFSDRDVRSRKKVALLGKTVVNKLFGSADPLGQRIRIGTIPFIVIGVLDEKGQNMMGDQDDVILAPCDTVLYRMSDGETVNAIMASAVSNDAMETAQAEVIALLRESHKLRPGANADFDVRSQKEILSNVTTVTGILTMLLGAIAGVSLLVGGIGIMNIMLVSVTERTREIGIRMAIGARPGDVMIQFLIESVILSLLGGAVGILVGIGLGKLAASLIHSSLVVSPMIIILAFCFSGAVGVFFGFYPSRKASRLNPIEALRYE
jgi:putative ABC transport system permease protein